MYVIVGWSHQGNVKLSILQAQSFLQGGLAKVPSRPIPRENVSADKLGD